MNGVLYLVSTPIGNLEDITLRALRVLNSCDLIACEDTRQSLKLLSYFKISKPLISFYSYNERRKIGRILEKLSEGKKIVLISDAGTPCISDPGYDLIKETIRMGIKIKILPGATAVIAAIVGSGLPTNGFVFCGFLKKKQSKIKKELSELLNLGKTIAFYESPHRVLKTVKICMEIFGESAEICLARELTKKFEEFIRGNIKEVLENIQSRQSLIGEFVVLIYPKKMVNNTSRQHCDELKNKVLQKVLFYK